MRVLGLITLSALCLAGAAVLGITVRSIPDIKRYLKIRSM